MSVNFTPNQNSYKNIGQFRFWCQKVLPLVYDDSMSYYELLNKVVHYLNETIKNVDLVGEDMTNLYTAYEQLQTWVNKYFDNLDVQSEINNKLDLFASDGTLLNLIKPIAVQLSQPTVVSTIGEMTNVQKTYVLSSNGHIYQYKGNAWADTGLVYATEIENYMTYSILSATDLNEVTTMGVYSKGSSASVPVNIPKGEGGSAFTLVVFSNNTINYRVQMYFPTNTNRMYIRKYNPSGTWYEWERVIFENDMDSLADYFKMFQELPSNDLNLLTENGVYFNISTNELLNTPTGMNNKGHACAIFVMSGKTYVRNYQMYFDYYTGNIYTRNSQGIVESWTPWVRLLNENDLASIVEGAVSISKTSDTVYGINFGRYTTNLVHTINSGNNIDAWNLLGIYQNGVTVVDTGTDFIGPIMELGEADFMGGLHGDELGTMLYITCDGKEWDYETTALCKEIKIAITSEIYRVSTKAHVYNRYVVLTISENKIVGEVMYKCLVNDSVIQSAPLGGLIGCPKTIVTGIVMNNYVHKGSTDVRPANYSRNNISGTIHWTNGSVTVNNLVGHEREEYTGVLVVYDDKVKVYLYVIPPSETPIEMGEEIFGKYEYLFS